MFDELDLISLVNRLKAYAYKNYIIIIIDKDYRSREDTTLFPLHGIKLVGMSSWEMTSRIPEWLRLRNEQRVE